MPSDSLEEARLDLAHECTYRISGHSLYHAPLRKEYLHRVLDFGTGTGIWAIEIADANPQADVLGIDLTPLQPRWIPVNCRFEIEDFEEDWSFSMPFDYIHSRTITQSVSNWPGLLVQVWNHLTPETGWFELGEYALDLKSDDGTIPVNWAPKVVWDLVREGTLRMGRMFPIAEIMEEMLRNAGFVDVMVETLKLPQGPWPRDPQLKELGRICAATADTGYEAYGYRVLTEVLDYSPEEAAKLCNEAIEGHIRDTKRKVHAYVNYHVVCGRKPGLGGQ